MKPAPGESGFTLIEALVVMAILGIIAAVGIPNMSSWLLARRAQAAAGYYMDGLVMARTMAIQHNGATRMVLNTNAVSGQMEWEVDLCFPTSQLPCDDQNGVWSTTSTGVTDAFGHAFTSVTRSASGLPTAATMSASFSPSGATVAYFTSLGWLNPAVSPQLRQIVLSPSYQNANAFAPVSVALTLAGIPSRCDPGAAAHTRTECPP